MNYLMGWLSGDGKQLFIKKWFSEKIKMDIWGVTYDSNDASLFNSPEDCIKFFISYHAFEEDAIEQIQNGYLIIMDNNFNQVHPLLYLEKAA